MMPYLLSVNLVSEILSVSPATVRRLIAAGELAGLKIGTDAVRVREDRLEQFIEKQSKIHESEHGFCCDDLCDFEDC